jgi:hypothetical protein
VIYWGQDASIIACVHISKDGTLKFIVNGNAKPLFLMAVFVTPYCCKEICNVKGGNSAPVSNQQG